MVFAALQPHLPDALQVSTLTAASRVGDRSRNAAVRHMFRQFSDKYMVLGTVGLSGPTQPIVAFFSSLRSTGKYIKYLYKNAF